MSSSMGSRRPQPQTGAMATVTKGLFQKSLRDIITGIRANKDRQKDYMNKCLQDIRAEVISPDIRTKAVAIEKATYLHSLGFNMTWASFHVVELMSCTNVKYKRVGYLAATQSFGDDTDVVLLIPNLLKKDLASPNPAEAALAISCLGNIVTPELSQTLVADVYSLLNNHKPELRRRACLCLYKCFLRYPEALRPSFARLTECLEDDDQTVVQAAVTVLAELAMHNPKTYLPLAPKFYKLLTTSSSNWMTIKLVKVFGALTPLEPRLAKKLVGPLSEILETTSAKSLLYECIRTVVAGMTSQEKIVRQAVDKLKDMLEDNDPNIKYLALHALTFLLESHPRIVAEHKGNIFMCVDHEDSNIQYCALKIVRGLVTKKTLMDTTAHLMGAMGKADQRFRDELVWSVIHVCMNDRYALVTDFVWYLTVLADLTKVPSSAHGGLVGDQLVDICLRVEVVRESAVAILKPLLLDPALLENTPSNATVPEALKSIAWIIGEYAHFITDVDEVVEALSSPNVTNLPAHVQAVYVQSLLKVYASAVATHAGAVRPPPAAPEPAQAPFDETAPPVVLALAAPGEEGDDAFAAERAAAAAAAAAPKRKPQPDTPMPRSDVLVPMSPSLARLGESIKENLVPFSVSLHLEVRERACQLTTILDIASAAEAHNPGEGVAIIEQFALVLSEEVQPVSLKAQRKIEPPACLSIKEPLSTQWDSLLVSSGDDDSGDDEEETRAGRKGSKKKNRKHKDVTDLFAQKKSKAQILQEEQEAREMLKRHREKMGNYYLGGEVPAKPPVSVEEGGKKNKKGKKGTVEALPPVPSPAEQEMPAYMKASMAGVKMARPAIKGESDSDSDDDDARENEKGFGKKALYAPKNSSAALHAGLGGYDPLKPLGRGEEMPSVAAYPEYDPYANQGGGAGGTNAFSVPQQGDRRKKEKKSKREKSTSKDEARAKHEARKASKKENEGEEKKPKKEKKGKEPTKEKEKGEKKEKKAKKGDKLASKMEKVSV